MVRNAMLYFLQYGEAVAENKLVGPTQLDNMVMKFNLFLKDFNDYPLRIK
jgi:hypothetical protein